MSPLAPPKPTFLPKVFIRKNVIEITNLDGYRFLNKKNVC